MYAIRSYYDVGLVQTPPITEWQQFKAPDWSVIKASLKQPVIFDGRNLFDPVRMKRDGFAYYAIGRGESIAQFN